MADASIHQLKITLRHIKPSIWRRFTVPSDVMMAQLHPIIQIVMGWEHFHLYEFRVSDLRFSPPPDWQDVWNEEGEYPPLDLLGCGQKPSGRSQGGGRSRVGKPGHHVGYFGSDQGPRPHGGERWLPTLLRL